MSDVLNIEKALDTTVGTTGNVLVPEIVEEGIRMFVETSSPLWNLIRKVQGDGAGWAYREQNGLPSASWGTELGALPAAQNATYAERFVPFKTIYIRGEISGQMIEASRTLVNILSREIDNSTRGMIRTLEAAILAGDSSSNPAQFDGMAKQITTTVDGDTDSGAGVTAGALTLALLEMLHDAAVGSSPTHYIMSFNMRRKLWSLLQSQVRFVDNFQTLDGGVQVPAYNGVPIIQTRDNGTLLQNTILAPDMNLIYMPVLKDFTYEELAKTRDSKDYYIKSYLTLVVEGAARHHAKAINISSVIA